jgi:hypothetical protein
LAFKSKLLGWQSGSSGRAPAQQVQGLEFTKNKNKNHFKNLIKTSCPIILLMVLSRI